MRLREGFVTHVVVMLVAAYGTGAATSADAASVVSTRKEGGVEIISSRSVPTIAPMPVAPGVPAASASPNVGQPAPAQMAPSATPAGSPDTVVTVEPDAAIPEGREAMKGLKATKPSGPKTRIDETAIRGDHRLRANLLTRNGTPNEEADNEAHRLVREHRAKVEADLKATLMAYDEGKRNGASREKLNKLQERIRADLDLVSTLSRAEQN
ncbi:hypothetical protein DA70_03965 [Pandoraea pnomenusa]|uniref:hypothetical protein n=1 Tax=Pandoraea pnomenusa TaxID=93220 RepID=UPI0004375AAB|nr:hypothetical protein [Pandoraea pnomenusa]AHN77317.1 hypothetical protein DA70_03965 [Pandoraea pnomenusa]